MMGRNLISILAFLVVYSCVPTGSTIKTATEVPPTNDSPTTTTPGSSPTTTFTIFTTTTTTMPGQGVQVDRTQGNSANGQTLYTSIQNGSRCISCHAADGEGVGSFPGVVGSTDSSIEFVLTNQVSPMPNYSNFFNLQQMNDLAAYIDTL